MFTVKELAAIRDLAMAAPPRSMQVAYELLPAMTRFDQVVQDVEAGNILMVLTKAESDLIVSDRKAKMASQAAIAAAVKAAVDNPGDTAVDSQPSKE